MLYLFSIFACLERQPEISGELQTTEMVSGRGRTTETLMIAQEQFLPSDHNGTGKDDCALPQYLMAFDTPPPNKQEMLKMCSDPKGLLYEISINTQGHVRRASLDLLGYFTEDKVIYEYLLHKASNLDSSWQEHSAALGALRKQGIFEEDIEAILPSLDVDNASVQTQAVLLLFDSVNGKEAVLSKMDSKLLHPAAARKLQQLLETQN